MSSAITIEGQKRISQLMGSELPLIIDRMVLALVPDLDLTQPVDRSQQLPDPAHIVHTQTIDADHKGYVDPDQVIYSIMMGSDVGDFSFNWIGTLEKDTDRVITVTITPETPKRKTNLPQNTTGNCITRNVILAFQNAQALTGITISAETWQFDYESKFNNHAERLVDPTKTGTKKAHMTNDLAKAWNDKIEAQESRFNALGDSLSLTREFEPHKIKLELFSPGNTLFSETTWTVDQTAGQAVAVDCGTYQATDLTVGDLSRDKTAVVRRSDNDAILAAFFRDATHTDWTPAPWAWRRDAGNGFVDVEYLILARGTFDFKIDSTAGHSAVDPTIDHIVFVECESGLGGTHQPPSTPTMVSPVNGATGVGEQPSLTTSAFSHPVGDKLHGTQFQISNKADFAADHIVKDSDVVPGISWSPDKGGLSTNTIYHVMAKHMDVHGGQSDWSAPVSFTTKSNFVTVNKPTCVSPAASEKLSSPDGLTLVSSAFSTEGGEDAHASSRWQVANDPAFTSIVHDSNETTSDKTSYNVPDDTVERGKTYYWRVMHKGVAEGWSDWSISTMFNVAVMPEVDEIFSTTLYTGNGATQDIKNGIDLAGEGGMVWSKQRTDSGRNTVVETITGANKQLFTDGTDVQQIGTNRINSFSADGYNIGSDTFFNQSGHGYASWTFRKAPRFFDVVKYTGDGVAGREIPHDLGVKPGMIITKAINKAYWWGVYHKGTTATNLLRLNETNAVMPHQTYWNNTEPTDTKVTLGSSTYNNEIGVEYIAYLFAHDPEPEGVIQCGSYVGNGSATGPIIDLSFKPQWLLTKPVSRSGSWYIYDNQRDGTNPNTVVIAANDSNKEADSSGIAVNLNTTGFQPVNSSLNSNEAGQTYIYMAIRKAEGV
jgi:hypothetical protein